MENNKGIEPIGREGRNLNGMDFFLLWAGAAVSLAEIWAGGLLVPLGFLSGFLVILIGHVIGNTPMALGGIIGTGAVYPPWWPSGRHSGFGDPILEQFSTLFNWLAGPE